MITGVEIDSRGLVQGHTGASCSVMNLKIFKELDDLKELQEILVKLKICTVGEVISCSWYWGVVGGKWGLSALIGCGGWISSYCWVELNLEPCFLWRIFGNLEKVPK